MIYCSQCEQSIEERAQEALNLCVSAGVSVQDIAELARHGGVCLGCSLELDRVSFRQALQRMREATWRANNLHAKLGPWVRTTLAAVLQELAKAEDQAEAS